MRYLVNFALGLLFGLGLALSGMSNPEKVLNFLDISRHWDPSLAFVMAGAVAVASLGYAIVLRRSRPILEDRFHVPATAPVERRLVVGSAIFGLGWGLSGLCPGPAFVAASHAAKGTLAFLPAMLIGIAVATQLQKRALPDADG